MIGPGRLLHLLGSVGLRGGGLVAIVWSVSVLPYFNAEQAVIGIAEMIRRGETFSPSMAAAASERVTSELLRLRPAILPYVDIVEQMRFERAIAGSDQALFEKEAAQFEATIKANLALNPADGFAWLSLFWLDTLRGATPSEQGYRYLRMSYRQAPNEGWIAERRNALVLKFYPNLPKDIAEAVQSEFVHVVRSFLYGKAAELFMGAPAEAQDTLLRGLDAVSEEQRSWFAAALRERQPQQTDRKSTPADRPWH